MQIRTLQNVSLQDLRACHNLAFSDYIVSHQITTQQLASSLHANSVQLEFSPGAFENDKLVGFMLIGVNELNGQKAFYNAGTGVIPEHRGRRIVALLYEFLMPLLKTIQVDFGILEVITKNKRALRIYEAVGYSINRKLLCFKGVVTVKENDSVIDVRQLHKIDFELLRTLWDWSPSWQNQNAAVHRIQADLHIAGAFIDGQFVGYLVYNPLQKRVHQFAVIKAARWQGIGTMMFSYIANNFGSELGVINVDERAATTISFLNSIGLKLFAEQYEMKLPMT